QPAALAATSGVAVVTGGVRSILMVVLAELLPPALVAVHVSVVPAVSALRVVASQPVLEVTDDSGSTTVHVTCALLVNHPPSPGVPRTEAEIRGGVVSDNWMRASIGSWSLA